MDYIDIHCYFELKMVDNALGIVSRHGNLIRFGEYQIDLTGDLSSENNGNGAEDTNTKADILKPSNKVVAKLVVRGSMWAFALREVKAISKDGRATLSENVLMISCGDLNSI